MEDGVSSYIPSSEIHFDGMQPSEDNYEEELEAAEEEERNKLITQDVVHIFNNLPSIHDDESSSSDHDHQDHHDSSDEEPDNSSQEKSESYMENSSVRSPVELREQTLPSNETGNLSSASRYSEKNPHDFESSYHSDEKISNNFRNYSPEHHWRDRNTSELNPGIINNRQHCEFTNVAPDGYSTEVKRPFEFDKYQTQATPNYHKYTKHNPPSDLEHECMKLNTLLDTQRAELDQIRRERIKEREAYNQEVNSLRTDYAALKDEHVKLKTMFDSQSGELQHVIGELQHIKKAKREEKKTLDQEVNALKLRLTHTEEGKKTLVSTLQGLEKSTAELRHENNELTGKLNAIQLRLSEEEDAKINAMSKFHSAEVTISSLQQQINGLTQSENAVRLREQNESIVKDLKLRHQREVLKLREEIDKLQQSLGSKINEADKMASELSRLQQRYDHLQVQKSEICNKLSAELEASQTQCKNLLLETETSNLSRLKIEVQQLQELKTKLEKENTELKEELRRLEMDFQMLEAFKQQTLENDSEESLRTHGDKTRQSSQEECALKNNLQKSLERLKSLRNENKSLKEKLDEVKYQLPIWQEKVKLFESQLKESELKVKDLQKKLEEVLPTGSIPVFEHEKSVNALQNEISDLKKKLHDSTKKLKSSSANEKRFHEDNKNLKSKLSEMVKSHASKTIEEVEKCREECLKLHEVRINEVKEQLASKYDIERENICSNYESKINKLEESRNRLYKDLDNGRIHYLELCEENKSLQMKIDSISKPKERVEIEREVKSAYQQKLSKNESKLKQLLEQNECLQNEIHRVKNEWTNQKMADVEKFIKDTKQVLDEKFFKCVEEEKDNYQSEIKAEKEKLRAEYLQKEKELKQQCEADKNDSESKLRESFILEWKNKIKELQQRHQNEYESINRKFETKILTMENEMQTLKANLCQKSQESEDIQMLKREFADQRHVWEKEKIQFMNNEHIIDQKLESALKEEKVLLAKVEKYRRYVSSQKKKYLEKVRELQTENKNLKQQLVSKREELHALNVQYNKHIKKESLRNSECQTEEKLVSHKTLLNIQDMFIQCLKKITDDIKTYMLNSKKRSAEQLHKALSFYHDHLISKIYQRTVKDVSPVTRNIYPSYTNENNQHSSSNIVFQKAMHQHFNSNHKISNSSPVDNLAAGDTQRRFVSPISDTNNFKELQNARTTPDSGFRLEDTSFDYLRMPDSALTSTKLPEYYVPTGLFNRPNIFPERDSPLSVIK